MCTALTSSLEKQRDSLYAVFRILVGFLFLSHGLQKLGLLGGEAQQGFMLFIGLAELVGGSAIMIGFLTQLAAIGAAIIMVGAYVKVHMAQALLPIDNKGELALLYLASFLVIIAYGAGKWSVDACCQGGRTSASKSF